MWYEAGGGAAETAGSGHPLGTLLALGACGGRDPDERATAEPAALAIPSPLPAPIQAALDDPRRATQRAADPRRHPGELIAAAGLAAEPPHPVPLPTGERES